MTESTTLVVIGDSVTETGRFDDPERGLGAGYVRFLADDFERRELPVAVVNRGIGGNRAVDLAARWQQDCLDLQPDVVSISVGINDTWRRYDSADPTSADAFRAVYRTLLPELVRRGTTIVLIEPFLLPVSAEQETWRGDLEEKIAVVHALADEVGAILVPADRRLGEYAREFGAPALAPDGVHPSPRGHELLASIWIDAVTVAPFAGG